MTMTTTTAVMSFVWAAVGVLSISLIFVGVDGVKQENRGMKINHWGFPSCPEAVEFVYMGFSQVTEATLVAGTKDCAKDMVLEYSGYLVTWRDDVAATEWECVNVTKKSTLRSSQYVEGQTLIFFTDSACGDLQWPPYKEGGVITCAICVKKGGLPAAATEKSQRVTVPDIMKS